MRTLLLVLIAFLIGNEIFAQKYVAVDSTGQSLQKIAELIQEDSLVLNRLRADSLFTKSLVHTLKQPYSFRYHFDSLRSVKHIKSPDGKFKLFTWQIDLGDGTFRQRGAIQFPTVNGHLKLLPFFDDSDFMNNTSQGIFSRKHWMGAIYYQIIPSQFNNVTYYTLLGFDEFTTSISRKVIEVMYFENEEPVFGGDFFVYPEDPTFPVAPVDRFVIQYKKGSNAIVQYDVFDKKLYLTELASTENELNNIATLVPSGNIKYFVWSAGKWIMKK